MVSTTGKQVSLYFYKKKKRSQFSETSLIIIPLYFVAGNSGR